MNTMSMFTFRNGCDKIVICSGTLGDAQELAFEQCGQMSEPLYLIDESECTPEIIEMMMNMQHTLQ